MNMATNASRRSHNARGPASTPHFHKYDESGTLVKANSEEKDTPALSARIEYSKPRATRRTFPPNSKAAVEIRRVSIYDLSNPMVALTMPSVPKNHKSGSASIRVRPRPAVVDARKSLPSLSKYSYRSLPFASRLHPHGESRRLARRFGARSERGRRAPPPRSRAVVARPIRPREALRRHRRRPNCPVLHRDRPDARGRREDPRRIRGCGHRAQCASPRADPL